MKSIHHLVRPNIRDLIPYSSARSEFKGKASVFLDANENPFDGVLDFNRYPDPLQVRLKEAISKKKDLPVCNIFLSNGSDEAIDILIRIFCIPGKDSILTFTPGFGMFKVAAAVNDAVYKDFPLDEEFQLDLAKFQEMISDEVKVVFLCSPNNPTGNSIPSAYVKKLCNECDTIVVVDEAYIDFSSNPSMISELRSHPNLVILQTLSKAFGGAGLRIGMAFASAEIVHYMNNVKMPYNISGINQEKALALLNGGDQYGKMLLHVLEEKDVMWKKLNDYPEIEKVFPSDANFFLIRLPNAPDVYHALVQKGVIVRNLSSKPGCRDCLRITVGTNEQNRKLYQCLDEILS